MKRVAASCLSMLLVSLTACGGSSSNGGSTTPAALTMGGTWTAKTVSTQGRGNYSGTGAVTQSGQGLGVNGTTTLNATVGQIAITQTGTALTGTITNTMKATTVNFTGTLSSGNITMTGSTPCYMNGTQTTTITGTVTSTSVQGTYTVTRSPSCSPYSDTGTFLATRQ